MGGGLCDVRRRRFAREVAEEQGRCELAPAFRSCLALVSLSSLSLLVRGEGVPDAAGGENPH